MKTEGRRQRYAEHASPPKAPAQQFGDEAEAQQFGDEAADVANCAWELKARIGPHLKDIVQDAKDLDTDLSDVEKGVIFVRVAPASTNVYSFVCSESCFSVDACDTD